MSKFRNQNLRDSLATMQPSPKLVEATKIPKPSVKNRQGHAAYSLDSWLRLLTMLNTLKLENQFYRSETETMKELKALVDTCAKEDPYPCPGDKAVSPALSKPCALPIIEGRGRSPEVTAAPTFLLPPAQPLAPIDFAT